MSWQKSDRHGRCLSYIPSIQCRPIVWSQILGHVQPLISDQGSSSQHPKNIIGSLLFARKFISKRSPHTWTKTFLSQFLAIFRWCEQNKHSFAMPPSLVRHVRRRRLESVATSLRTKGHEPLVVGSQTWQSYCGWKKSCISWYTIIYMVLYIPGGAGFLPSTVSSLPTFCRPQVKTPWPHDPSVIVSTFIIGG